MNAIKKRGKEAYSINLFLSEAELKCNCKA